MEKLQEVPQATGSVTLDNCPTCQKAAQEAARNEETSLAFLLALVPVLALTFFGQVGLL